MSNMSKAEFLSKIHEIGTCEDDVQRRTLLSQVNEGVSTIFDSVEDLQKANDQLTTDNETIRKANMQLFQQIGVKDKPEDTPPPEPEAPKRTYQNLFNDKGRLK